jgi:IS5 family transposase
VQKVKVTAANVSDVATIPELLTGEEEVVYGDSGYLGAQKREDAILKNKQGKRIRYKINRRPSQIKNGSLWSQGQRKRREREKSSVRAKVEHVFAVIKDMFRYRKTRYRGLAKQIAALNIRFTLANLVLADRPSLTA